MPETADNKTVAAQPSAPQAQGAPIPAAQAASQEPKKEKTTKGMTNLILEQIRSLIEINVALNAKAKELSMQQDSIEKNIKKMEDGVKGFDDRIGKIETNMEKFIGLYEIVTNKYNPFLDSKDKNNFNVTEKDSFEGIDLNKLKDDAKKIILDIRKKQGIGTDGKESTDELTSEINETVKKVPKDVTFPEEELTQKSGAKIDRPTLESFGNAKKSDAQPQIETPAANMNIGTPAPQQQTASNADQTNAPKKEEAKNDESKELELLSSKFQFMLKDGRLIKTLPELAAMLDDMSDDVFNHHVNQDKNDFYEWIKHSIDKDIAENIRNDKTKDSLKKKLIEHINLAKKK